MSVDSLIAELSAIHPKGFDLSLERISRLLRSLGSPHERIPPAIHLAGTNGKGSTAAFCRAILESCGMSVHVHASPHLLHWRERYRLGAPGGGPGRFAREAELESAIRRAAEANRGSPITVFELLSAAMFLLFSESPADFCVVEVGLGGRLDATNAIARPLVSVLCPVALDHRAQLGATHAEIAAEKAGIVKPGRPVAIARQDSPEALRVLESAARRAGRPAWIAERDFFFRESDGRFLYRDPLGELNLPLPRLRGAHQLVNASTAMAALRLAGFEAPDSAFARAMRSVSWPARMQRLRKGRLASLLPAGCELWVDGAHNRAAADALAHEFDAMAKRDSLPLFLIASMLSSKEPEEFFAAFRGVAERAILTPSPGSDDGDFGGIEPEALAGFARLSLSEAHCAPDLGEAVRLAARLAPESGARILVCGSLHLAGDALRRNGSRLR